MQSDGGLIRQSEQYNLTCSTIANVWEGQYSMIQQKLDPNSPMNFPTIAVQFRLRMILKPLTN
jgi:hypothetical protein